MAEGSGSVRILCLGNDLIADDAVGPIAAPELRRRVPGAEVITAAAGGLSLLDELVGVDRLIVVDAIVTGAAPGTIHVFSEADLAGPAGGSAHYVGLFESLDLARALGLGAPDEVLLACVEALDTTTIGGAMTEPVRRSLPSLVETVAALVSSTS